MNSENNMEKLMQEIKNDFGRASKQKSWNDFGTRYWHLVAENSHPSVFETQSFLDKIDFGIPIAVIGATTRELIDGIIKRHGKLVVFDFAQQLLELAVGQYGNKFVPVLHDIGLLPIKEYQGIFSAVLSDRLLNRFHISEMAKVLANMSALLKIRGVIRASVRFGLYPLDERLIAEGKKQGTLERFWDLTTQTINWGQVGTELNVCAERIGEIPKEVVIEWSRKRGVETRLQLKDMPVLLKQANNLGACLKLTQTIKMDRAPNSLIFEWQRI